VQAGNVEHQAAVLQDVAGRIAHGKAVHEDVDGRSVLAPQDFFVIAHLAARLSQFREFLPPLRRKIDLGGNVELKHFVAAAVAEDANQRVVDFDEAALGVEHVDPFLNVVEQFAIPAFRFAPVGDVLEHVHGLQLGAAGGVNARGRNQVGAFETGWTYSSSPSPLRQKGQEWGEAAGGKRFQARMLMPINWSGADAD
jgi:hypothetical protein